MATETEEIMLRMGFNAEAVTRGMRAMVDSQSAAANEMKGIWSAATSAIAGFFTVGQAAEMYRSTVEFAKQIELTSERLAVSTDEAQKLSGAAQMAGVNLDFVAGAFDRLAKSKETAIGGGKGSETLAKSFADFGIQLSDLKKLSPYKIFNKLSESIQKTGINSKVTADLLAVMGRGAGALKPLLLGLPDLENQADVTPPAALKDLESQGRWRERMANRVRVMVGSLLSPELWSESLFTSGESQARQRNLRNTLLTNQANRSGEMRWIQDSLDAAHATEMVRHRQLVSGAGTVGRSEFIKQGHLDTYNLSRIAGAIQRGKMQTEIHVDDEDQ